MKILKLLFLSLFVSFAISCSTSDDDGDGDTGSGVIDAELTGIWIGSEVEYTGTTITEFQGISFNADFVGVGYDIDYTFDFTENPNELTAEGTYSIELTTTSQGQTIIQNVENLSFNNLGTWSRDGNELSLTYNGEIDIATITELTETTLILNIFEETVTELNGTTVTTTIDSFFSYSRQ